MQLRERYAAEGPEALGDAEILALVLGTGIPGRPVLALAEDLLREVGGLPGLARTPVPALARLPGLGLARAARLHAAVTLGRRALRDADPRPPVTSAAEAYQLLRPQLAGLDHEELHALFLDRRHHLLARRVLSRGDDAHTVVDPRMVFRQALLLGAAAVIVAHNHPSGSLLASRADIEVTERLARAGELLGLPLLDHLLVTGSGYRSLRESGFLPPGA